MYILSNPHLVASAKLLSSKIEELRPGSSLSVATIQLPRERVAFRWGNSVGHSELDNSDPRVSGLNTKALIMVGGNKKALSNLLKRKEIPHVEFNEGTPDHFPVFVRKELNRGGGIGIVICKTVEEFSPLSQYSWSYYYNFSTEMGVHMLGGKVLKVLRKEWDKDTPEPEYPIRNSQHDYKFSRVSIDRFPKLKLACDKLYEVFPAGYGRIDIGWDSVGKVWRVIEFNSAPDLTQNSHTLQMYAEFLAGRLENTL